MIGMSDSSAFPIEVLLVFFFTSFLLFKQRGEIISEPDILPYPIHTIIKVFQHTGNFGERPFFLIKTRERCDDFFEFPQMLLKIKFFPIFLLGMLSIFASIFFVLWLCLDFFELFIALGNLMGNALIELYRTLCFLDRFK